MDRAGRLATESNQHGAEDFATPGFVRVGRISGAHGLDGGLRMRPDNPDSDSLQHVSRVHLRRGAAAEERGLRSARRVNRATIKLVLDGISDANAAEAMRGALVMVAEADLPAVAPGEFYYYQALGCEVVTTAGMRVGVIEDIFSAGANDVWAVRDGEREVLVPVIEDVVKSIDIAARRAVIEPVPGLLD
jgi:16S rRNA processing protein RimM